MIQVDVQEAQLRLPELLAAAQQGERVEIQSSSGGSYFLLPVPKQSTDEAWPGYPAPGSLKGQIWMAPDFDEPLEELREYME